MMPLLLGAGTHITVRHRLADATDAHGNPVTRYSEPVQVFVYAVSPQLATESTEAGQDFSTDATWEIYAPADVEISPFDEITLPTGEIAELTGKVKRWSQTAFQDLLGVSGASFVVTEKK